MKGVFLIICFLASSVLFAQEYIEHSVSESETIYFISKKYKVSPNQIMQANPGMDVNALAIGTILKVPVRGGESQKKHIIAKGDTWYNLGKKYGFTVEELQSKNPDIIDGFDIGKVIVIPTSKDLLEKSKKVSNSNTTVELSDNQHVVSKLENWYRLSKKYNLSIDELKGLNPHIVDDYLRVGDTIFVKKNNKVISTSNSNINNKTETEEEDNILEEYTPVVHKPTPYIVKDSMNYETVIVEHKIAKQETVFGILKKYQISIEKLKELNPSLNSGLKEGATINVPILQKKVIVKEKPKFSEIDLLEVQPSDRELFSIEETVNKEISVVYLLPFYSKYADKKRKYTTGQDFYLGSEFALVNLKDTFGLDVEALILDTNGEDITEENLNKIKEFNPDLIIGPFYTPVAESVAATFDSIPVISPFSRNHILSNKKNLVTGKTSETVEIHKSLDFLRKKSDWNNLVFFNEKNRPSLDSLIQYKYNEVYIPSNVTEFLDMDSILGNTHFVFDEMTKSTSKKVASKIKQLSKQNVVFKITSLINNKTIKKELGEDMLKKIEYTHPEKRPYKNAKLSTLSNKMLAKYKGRPNSIMIHGYDLTLYHINLFLENDNYFDNLLQYEYQGYGETLKYYKVKAGGYFIDNIEIVSHKQNDSSEKQILD